MSHVKLGIITNHYFSIFLVQYLEKHSTSTALLWASLL